MGGVLSQGPQIFRQPASDAAHTSVLTRPFTLVWERKPLSWAHQLLALQSSSPPCGVPAGLVSGRRHLGGRVCSEADALCLSH